jgi:hypothetical protein
MAAHNYINTLRELEWDGLVLQATNIQTSWSHDLAERLYPYQDGAKHDNTGRRPIKVSATIHFSNTVGLISNLSGTALETTGYPTGWQEFAEACLTGDIGELKHPDESIGKFDARVTNITQNMDSMNTAGVVVDVAWVESGYEIELKPQVPSPELAASKLAGDIEILYPDGEYEPDLLDTLDQLDTLAFQIGTMAGGVVNRAKGIVDDLNRFFGPDTNPASVALMDIGNALKEASEIRLEVLEQGGRPTSEFNLERDMTHEDIAEDKGNTIDEIFTLNPGTLQYQIVPEGTLVTWYAD